MSGWFMQLNTLILPLFKVADISAAYEGNIAVWMQNVWTIHG